MTKASEGVAPKLVVEQGDAAPEEERLEGAEPSAHADASASGKRSRKERKKRITRD